MKHENNQLIINVFYKEKEHKERGANNPRSAPWSQLASTVI